MFFNQTASLDIKKYIKDEWVSIPQFYDKLRVEKTLNLKGYGFIEKEVTSQFSEFLGYHIIRINDRLFGFCGKSLNGSNPEENSILFFKNITEFKIDFLNSALFEESQYKENSNRYIKFDADLTIEAKIYLYEDEEKLLLSKKGQGNIDLYCSYQVENKSNELICKIYPAAFSAAKYLAMNKILDERIQSIKK